MLTPVVPIWRSAPIQPASVTTRVAPADAPSAAATRVRPAKTARASSSVAPRPHQPGAAAEHPGGVGEIHGRRVRLDQVEHLRPGGVRTGSCVRGRTRARAQPAAGEFEPRHPDSVHG